MASEKKKQNEKKRKAENHHKYIMGGIIVKYFLDCYRYDEGELNRIKDGSAPIGHLAAVSLDGDLHLVVLLFRFGEIWVGVTVARVRLFLTSQVGGQNRKAQH